MRTVLILGRGFGLYGYLPAALNNGWHVATDFRYKEEIKRRSELSTKAKNIELIKNPELEIDSFDCVVIAKKPMQQQTILNEHLNYKGYFFLEKPLAPTLSQHRDLVLRLKVNNTNFAIAYLFRYLDWYKTLVNSSSTQSNIALDWIIPTSKQNGWKSSNHEGGGVINYYLIHFLPLLMDLKMKKNDLEVSSNNDGIKITASNQIQSISISITLSYSKNSLFQIESITDKKNIWISKSPFGQLPSFGSVDPRVAHLTRHLEESVKLNDSIQSLLLEEEILSFLEIIKIKAGS